MTTVQTLATYMESEIDTFANLEVTTELQTALIAYTDGDDAITIADGGGITAAAGITSTAAANTLGATSFNEAAITNVGDIALDSISADGNDINIALTDNRATAFTIKESTAAYLIIDTANSSESVSIGTGVESTIVTIGHATSETTVADNLSVTGNVTISGNLLITGDSSEVKADDLVVDNATIAMGTTNGAAPSADSGFDIGLMPHWHTGSGAKTAFLGVDVSTSASAPKLTYIPDASYSSNVVSGTAGIIVADLEGTVTTAAQASITSLGDLTALVVDDVAINGKVVTMTGSTDDTAVFTVGTHGTLSIVTTDTAAAAANIQITADGTVDIDSAGVLTLDSGAAINIEPAAGSAILLDGTISVDAGVVTGATSITSTAFVGALSTAAQTNVTSLGTLTALTVDDVAINGKVITMTGSSSDTAVFTAGTHGTLSIVTTDAAAAAANIQITADGTVDIDSAGVLTLDSGAAINIEPAAGSAILLDGTISVDAGVVTGATSVTSTAFVGDITGDITGNADTATLATSFTASANNSTDETVYPVFVDGATGTQGAETDTGLTYNPSSGNLAISGELAAATLDISGAIDVVGTTNLDIVDIDGAVNMAADLTMGANILMGDDTSIGIADDAERIEFDGAGDISFLGCNVGIGVAAPNTNLVIEENSSDVLGQLKISQLGAGDASMFFVADSEIWAMGLDNSDSNKFKISTDTGSADVGVATKFTIQQDGNVGIGTDSPAEKLSVVLAAGATRGMLELKNTSDNSAWIVSDANLSGAGSGMGGIRQYWNGTEITRMATHSGTDTTNKDDGELAFYTRASGAALGQRMVIDPSGNVGIGTTAPSNVLHVAHASSATMKIEATGGADSEANLFLDCSTGSSTDQSALYFTRDGGHQWRLRCPDGGLLELWDYSDGSRATHVATGGSNWVNDSDVRMKENIVDEGSRLQDVLDMKVRRWDWKANGSSDLGFIAQELNDVCPEAVEVGNDEVWDNDSADDSYKKGDLKNPWALSEESIVPALVKAVQELSAKVEALENA